MDIRRRVCGSCGNLYIEEGGKAALPECEGCACYRTVDVKAPTFLLPTDSFLKPKTWRPTRGDGKGGYSFA